jgi:hypothetical protein
MNVKNGMTVSKRKKMPKKSPKPRIKLPGNSSDSNPFSIQWPTEGGQKLVGGYVPQRDADYLALLAACRSTTISGLLRQAIQRLIDEGEPEEDMVQLLVDKTGLEWRKRLETNQGESGWINRVDVIARFREYQQETRLLLIKRSLSEPLIMRIVKRMENQYGGM